MQQVPGFMTLPLAHQLQHMHKAQVILQQRQMQQRAAQQQQQQGAGSSQGFMQPGLQAFQNPGMSSGQAPGQSVSPTRVSPISQQSPMQGQSSAGGLPFSNPGQNTGVDPRLAGLNPQQQAAFAQLSPQQRQLWLMQRQMHGGNTSMVNPQQLFAAQEQMRREQQRLAQVQMAQNAGSSMPTSMDASQFAALRSNPAVPGIARSTRTPSDSAPSPGVSQRISGHTPEDLQRAAMLMQHQAQQRGMNSQMQQNAGFSQMNWPQTNQAQMAQMNNGQGSYGMSPPNSAGATHGGFGGMSGVPSPQTNAQNQWQQNVGNNQFPFVAPSSGGQHLSEPVMTPRQASATPVPHQMQNSPQPDQGGLNDFDIFNWGQ